MRTPNPQSAMEQIRALANQVQQAVDELLRYSELRLVAGHTDYREWHATNPAAGSLRAHALRVFHAFQEEFSWVVSRDDFVADQRGMMLAEPVFDIIDQHAHTRLTSLSEASRAVSEFLSHCLESVAALHDSLDGENLVIPDTSTLIDLPDLDAYNLSLSRATVVFTPIVIRELDTHRKRDVNAKDAASENRRRNARDVIRRLKQCGDEGDILQGVPISERVSLMALATEPRRESVAVDNSLMLPSAGVRHRGPPDWLDLDIADDRFIASALEVKREHPKARIVVLSEDFNVLTKARQARLSAFDVEAFLRRQPGSPESVRKTPPGGS